MNRRTFVKSVVGAVLGTGCFRPQAGPPAPVQVDRLLELMNKRFAVMLDVARAKWNTKAPTEDPARERALLAAMADAGREFDLDPVITTAFFAAQIEAAKIIQRAAFSEWEAEKRGPFPDAPDLIRDIRPKIDAIGRELLKALAEFKRGGRIPSEELQRRAETWLVGPCVTNEVRAVAVKPLEEPSA